MLSAKSNPKGLKVVECKHSVGDKNTPIRYIPEQDPVQDVLEKTKKTTYFKLTLPNTGNKLKVAFWASGSPEQFFCMSILLCTYASSLVLRTKKPMP